MSVRLRPLLLPVEHGGWALLVEPIVIGAIAAPSRASAPIALAAVALFLSRHPLSLALADTLAGRRVPRTRVAWAIVAACLIVAVLAGLVAWRLSVESIGQVVALAAPWALVPLAYDSLGRHRRLVPELAGAVALAGSAAVMGRAAGEPLANAAVLASASLLRTLPAVVTIRILVQRLRGESPGSAGGFAAHGVTLAVAWSLIASGMLPATVGVVATLLAGRAVWILNRPPRGRATRIGVIEFIVGLVASTVIGLSFR
jgi:hypothetical protein